MSGRGYHHWRRRLSTEDDGPDYTIERRGRLSGRRLTTWCESGSRQGLWTSAEHGARSHLLLVEAERELRQRSAPDPSDGLTRNALIPFKDGWSYLELVAFVDPEDGRDNVWGWRRFLSSGGGLIDYCVASDDLRADAVRLEEGRFEVDRPTEGWRLRPDGKEIRSLIARIRQEGRLLPFLIEDLTPRELRVPAGPATEHPNGALGIRRLQIATPDTEEAVRAFATFAGSLSGLRTSL